MEATTRGSWHPQLNDPHGERDGRYDDCRVHTTNKYSGKTMIIDKGLGRHAFEDLIETSGAYVDCVKLGFGTSPLYSDEMLHFKIEMARKQGILIMPGGTLLEAAVHQNVVGSFFDSICRFGFNAIEVSDGTIELSRSKRTDLIREGVNRGLTVFTEYGKKEFGSTIDPVELEATAEADWEAGAELLTVEARESGIGVGLFDEQGECKLDTFERIMARIPEQNRIMWEAPLKSQQVMLIRSIGPNVNLGNIHPADIITLEAMRRGLRNDTFPSAESFRKETILYMI
ncbi:phosphosulfolactate synthase [Paenibacillus tarimensis]